PVLIGDIATIPMEGSLLPETYDFSYHDTRQNLIERMKKSMQEELRALWEKRAGDIPFATPDEAVTLASIVEKETRLHDERPRVAGVFINRLKKHIPLQSDPTVIYAVTLGQAKLDRVLTYKDLQTSSAYNTYSRQGLPPTPIANPGRASLAAVLNPEHNDYIYFVANGTGGHVFAKTLKEHNHNVAQWRKMQKNVK
ncbi:MAG: endolytic transglycosylase MltG, partial [Proteobacteria bacterium]|nr:endolytic transglycosylase MltG [Pseudomonadota bacterium]